LEKTESETCDVTFEGVVTKIPKWDDIKIQVTKIISDPSHTLQEDNGVTVYYANEDAYLEEVEVGDSVEVCAEYNSEYIDYGYALRNYNHCLVKIDEEKTGSLIVTIEPSDVISEAGWKLTSGPNTGWHSSGGKINIPVGPYTIRFKDVSGWTKPGDRSISITEWSNSKSGRYEPIFTCDNPPEVYFDKSTYYEGDTILATVSTTHSSGHYNIFGCDDVLYYGGDASNGATISYTIPKTDASTSKIQGSFLYQLNPISSPLFLFKSNVTM